MHEVSNSLYSSFLALGPIVHGLLHERPHGNMMPTIPTIKISDGRLMSRNGTKMPSITLIDWLTTPNLGLGTDIGTPRSGMSLVWRVCFFFIIHRFTLGGPIILLTPESNADGFEGYLTDKTNNGQIAQQQKGATIVLEHRFYGQSNPCKCITYSKLSRT